MAIIEVLRERENEISNIPHHINSYLKCVPGMVLQCRRFYFMTFNKLTNFPFTN